MTEDGPEVEPCEPLMPGVVSEQDGVKYLRREYADAFLGLIRASESVFSALDCSLRDEYGISLHEYEVLLFLAVFSDDQTMPMTELRRLTPLSQSRVSRVVSGLDNDGLVERVPDPADSRAVTVVLTQEGLEKYRSAQDCHLRGLHENLFSVLTKREVAQLASITAKILSAGPDIKKPRRTKQEVTGAHT